MESRVGVALLGSGTVGGGVADLLEARRAQIEARSGVSFTVAGVANRSRDPIALTDDPAVDLVVECIGGTGIALECIERALERGKHVVTANKDAIATQGPRLRALAASRGASLRYEAAVASAIPILGAVAHGLAGDRIIEIAGILNGTCNVMLGLMRAGASFADALAYAQREGFAEADPRSDLEGTDTAHKLAILLQHAFETPVVTERLTRRGITEIGSGIIRRARQHGYEVKLIAYGARDEHGLRAAVGPMLVPFTHPFARIGGVENIVRVRAVAAGLLSFTGPGAGRLPSASAVAGDVVAALRDLATRQVHRPPIARVDESADVTPAFDRFPVFAGLPILTTTSKGETHVGDRSRTLSAV